MSQIISSQPLPPRQPNVFAVRAHRNIGKGGPDVVLEAIGLGVAASMSMAFSGPCWENGSKESVMAKISWDP
jgi:hypothetical protein